MIFRVSLLFEDPFTPYVFPFQVDLLKYILGLVYRIYFRFYGLKPLSEVKIRDNNLVSPKFIILNNQYVNSLSQEVIILLRLMTYIIEPTWLICMLSLLQSNLLTIFNHLWWHILLSYVCGIWWCLNFTKFNLPLTHSFRNELIF